MAPHDMELARLVDGVLDGLSAAAVTAAAAVLDDSEMAAVSRPGWGSSPTPHRRT